MFRAIIFISFIVLCFASCHEVNESKELRKTIVFDLDPINQATWFLGSWKNLTKDGLFTENWKYMNDSLYNGKSYIIQNEDTVFYESIDLKKLNNEWYYIVSVRNQNKELPVSFKLISLSPNQLVFENAKHDFPNKITYSKILEDSMVASISGLIGGKEKIELFPMKKTK